MPYTTYHWMAAAESLNQQVFHLLTAYTDCIYSSQTAAAEVHPYLQCQCPFLQRITSLANFPPTHTAI